MKRTHSLFRFNQVFALLIVSIIFFTRCGDDDEVTNMPPSISNQTFSVSEDITSSDELGTVVAEDAEEDDLTFSITQNDNNLFAITSNGELSLSTGMSLDFETSTNHTITVEVTDGSNASEAFITINVTDVSENTAPTINDQNFTVAEDIGDDEIIGNIIATDADGDALTYEFEIPNVFDGLFEIAADGGLSLAPGKSLDFETVENYQFGVTVSDGTESTTGQIRVNVTDVDENINGFITTWRPTLANMRIDIPVNTTAGFTYDYTIDWGDGTVESNISGSANHTYATVETYQIEITGDFPAIVLLNNVTSAGQIRTIEQWGDIQWQSMYGAFANTTSLIINATDAPDLSQVTDMSFMFTNSVVNQSLNNWDVSNVTNMASLFSRSSFNEDISGWDVSSVTNMSEMFKSSEFNQDIGAWNVSNVTDMFQMFNESSFNQDIGAWNVGKVTRMIFMFQNTPFDQDIGAWDVSNVTSMQNMFSSTDFNQDISSWNVSKVTNMNAMFFSNSSFNQNIGGWDVSKVTSTASMFQGATSFNQDISSWNVENVIQMGGMFRQSAFNQDIGAWNVGKVMDMTDMFRETDFNQDIGNWDVSSVTNMFGMFMNTQFNQDISSWDVSNVTTMSFMLSACPFNQNISGWDVSNVTACGGFAGNGTPLTPSNTPNFTMCTP